MLEENCEKDLRCEVLELLLSQKKDIPRAVPREKLTRGADPEGWDEETWGDAGENSSQGTEKLEEKVVRLVIKAETYRAVPQRPPGHCPHPPGRVGAR